jgi:hypothetical protein
LEADVSNSAVGFREALFGEHLQECGTLHAQCRYLQAQAGLPWQAPTAFEQRLEDHLDALVIGDASALEFCRRHVAVAESQELFGVVALACRLEDAALLQEVLGGAALADDLARAVIADALLLEWPSAWEAACMRTLSHGDLRLAATFAAIAATRGFAIGDALVHALERCAPVEQTPLLHWVGRVRGSAPDWLPDAYESTDAGHRAAALGAGLRLHDEEARRRVLQEPQPALLLALCAGRGAAAYLLHRLQGDRTEPAVLAALGQLGELSAVRALTALLVVKPVAMLAAQALHLITGAELCESARAPEQVPASTRAGVGYATRNAAESATDKGEQRLSLDPEVWGQWLVDNGHRFAVGRRYRLGLPCSAETLLRSLGNARLSAPGREALVEELQIRHGITLAWHAALPVGRQWSVLRNALPAVKAETSTSGEWYWAGEPLQG